MRSTASLGDAGMADRTLFPHAFGLRMPAALWTSPAFDRCILLASIYPIVTILLIWAVSGHVGQAEAALLLKPDYSGWQRGFLVAGSVSLSIAGVASQRIKGWKLSALVIVAGIGGSFVSPAFKDIGIFVIGSVLSMALGLALTVTYTGAGTYVVCGVGSMSIHFAWFHSPRSRWVFHCCCAELDGDQISIARSFPLGLSRCNDFGLPERGAFGSL